MKENTKYQNYRFVGKINIDEIQPWFDFATAKPWDDPEIPWILDNKVRREILIILAKGPKTFQEICAKVNFSPKPLLITKDEYDCQISYKWTEKTVENHLMNLEWYNLIELINKHYELAIPILSIEDNEKLEEYLTKFTQNWVTIIKQLKDEVKGKFEIFAEKTPLYEMIIEKSTEKLYNLLKEENLLPKEPNLKTLWAEQLRKIKFEEWVGKNF
ncbi:MAG: winged helix-turn-helix domain-containing protein [Promethearchaeota archaeon]